MTICIICQGDEIAEVVQENLRYYYCKTCNRLYERAHTSRYGRDIAIKKQEGVWHTSVGAVIKNDERILLVKRRSYPFGYDFPAGHVEYGEEPIDAVQREVLEETGLRVTETELLYQGEMVGNKCKYGADHHNWFFFECQYIEGRPFLNSENETYGWFSKEEVKKLMLIPS